MKKSFIDKWRCYKNMSDSRLDNTKRNIIFSYISAGISLAFSFMSRTIITQVLGDEYLGLSSLFVSIFQVLNMAELGFSSAIIYNMYKPIAENNVDKVCALLNYYKKIYKIVAVIIFGIGFLISPFLPLFIKGSYPSNVNIYILYYLFLINTGSSYLLFAYKTALLTALQRLDLTKIAITITCIIQYIMQIISLVGFKNYYLFVFWMIFGTICSNILSAYIAKKQYPQFECRGDVTQDTKDDIRSRVKGIFICNISRVTYTTFDSIILSSFTGLTLVAIYSNYLTIFNGVSTFIVMIRTAMQASVGNSVAVESKQKNYNNVFLWQFLFSFIATVCTTCMLVLYQPFMKLWMGESRLLPFIDVIMICLWFYTTVVENSFFLYLGGNGFWWEMRWPYILSAITNIVLNLIFGKLFGVSGIIFATVFSTIIFGQIWQCLIVFKNYFNTSMKLYQVRQLLYLAVCVLSCVISWMLSSFISIEGIIGLIVKTSLCIVISFLSQILVYQRMDEYRIGKNIALGMLHIL